MSKTIVVVDAFTDQPFAGNPAAVCILPSPASDAWMRDVAREMNLSETAFLHPAGDGYALRWLTPAVEVDLCGHATLASAHVLWQDGYLDRSAEARFHTRSGVLTAKRAGDQIVLDFPLKRGLTPDHGRLARLPVRGVIVTSSADQGRPYDFVSRFFAPGSGIAEDPVTGSAHCALAPYWSARLKRDPLVGFQASARGGTVRTECKGDRVALGGQAVIVLRAHLL
jgi:predicted PhzF superfamily epimerase YddE/YHI9